MQERQPSSHCQNCLSSPTIRLIGLKQLSISFLLVMSIATRGIIHSAHHWPIWLSCYSDWCVQVQQMHIFKESLISGEVIKACSQSCKRKRFGSARWQEAINIMTQETVAAWWSKCTPVSDPLMYWSSLSSADLLYWKHVRQEVKRVRSLLTLQSLCRPQTGAMLIWELPQ